MVSPSPQKPSLVWRMELERQNIADFISLALTDNIAAADMIEMIRDGNYVYYMRPKNPDTETTYPQRSE